MQCNKDTPKERRVERHRWSGNTRGYGCDAIPEQKGLQKPGMMPRLQVLATDWIAALSVRVKKEGVHTLLWLYAELRQLHIYAAVLDEHANMTLWKKDTALKKRDKDGTGFLFPLSSVCIFIILCKEKCQSVTTISFCWWSTSFCLKVLNTAMI